MHYSSVCGDAGINKATALPAVYKHSMYNYVRRIPLVNENEQLCCWFVCLLHYAFYCYVRVYT